MARWGLLFPGQGSQVVGMGKQFADRYALSKLAFQEADDALSYPLSRIIFEGPAEALEDTEVQQPAILVTSVAAWRALRQERPEFAPTLAIGLSLGEYSALVSSGFMAFSDAVRLTRLRGRAMQNAVPKGVGGMTAVMGLERGVVEEICRTAGRDGNLVGAANFNAPGQIVISGYVAGLDAAEALIREAGGRAVRLKVSAPFHSALLEPAGQELAQALADIALAPGEFPVLANVDAEYCRQPEDVVPRLIAQVSRPVRFEDSVRRALADGVDHFMELGPGRTLTSLVKKIDRHAHTAAVESPDGLHKALELV